MPDTPDLLSDDTQNQSVPRPAWRIPRADAAILIAIVLGTFAAYSSVIHFGFLAFDDQLYVTGNVHLRNGLALRNLRWIFRSFSPDNWFPVTRLSLIFDYRLFRLHAGWYHAENVTIHSMAAMLLFGFLRRATRVRWPCAFVALVFALHPLHVESVAWVAERKDVLCAFFWFATLSEWLRYTELRDAGGAGAGRAASGHYAGALVFFALGLMSKPMIVTLPILLFLIDLWPLRRVFSRRLVTEKIPFVVLSCAVMWITLVAQRGAMAGAPPLALRLQNALNSVAVYIGKAAWPASLGVAYPFPLRIPVWQTLAAAAGIAAVCFLAVQQRLRRPWLAMGWFWFLCTLIPVIGLVQVGDHQARADRYMYVPLVGLSVMVAWAAEEAVARRQSLRRPAAAAGVVCCLAMAVQTRQQTRYWENTEELFQHAIDLDSGNYVAWGYLGSTLITDQGLDADVISCFRRALEVRPDDAPAHSDLGDYLCHRGRTGEGLAELRAALQIRPNDGKMRCNLAKILWDLGEREKALEEYRTAVRLDPDYVIGQLSFGAALAMSGHPAEGISHLEEAVRINPDDEPAQFNLGSELADTPGHLQDAIRHLTAAVQIDSESVEAHTKLAAVLLTIPGRRLEAIDHLETVQRIAPTPERRRQLDELELLDAIQGR